MDRESALSVVVEQLKKPKFVRIQKLLDKAMSAIGSGFEFYIDDLRKHYTQARDNVKFLYTVLRDFKVIDSLEKYILYKIVTLNL